MTTLYLKDFQRYPKDMKIIEKYFGDTTEKEISTMTIVLNNYEFSRFNLSEEANALLASKSHVYDEYDRNIDLVQMRTNTTLIDTIKEIGLTRASGDNCSLYFATIPAKYIEYVKIREFDDDSEYVIFDYDEAVLKNITDDTISSDEMRSRLIEIAFIRLSFNFITRLKL